MSAKFFRLYRALVDEGANKTICAADDTCLFELERREALDSLGFKVGYKADTVLKKNKHHGMLARNKVNMKSRKITAVDDQGAELLQWKRDYHIKLQEINKYQSLALEMKEALLSDSKKVPNSLWKKFEDPHSSAENKIEKKNPYAKPKSIVHDSELPNLAYTPVFDIQNEDYESQRREKLTAPNHRWSTQEKKKITDLYWELARPTSKAAMAWTIYYQMFVARFLEFYPNKPVDEVRRKIEQMLALRQLKMSGEEEYWKEQVRKPAANSSNSIYQNQKPSSMNKLPPISEGEKTSVPEVKVRILDLMAINKLDKDFQRLMATTPSRNNKS